MHAFITKPGDAYRQSSSAPGSTLQISVVLFVLIIAFMGIAAYTGLNSYLQEELQKTAGSAAMFGAAAYYDGDTQLEPVRASDRARTAAQAVFANTVSTSTALQSYRATLAGVTLDEGNDAVTVRAEMTVPVPFLRLVGINELAIEANAMARYVKQSTGPVTVASATPPPPGCPGAGGGGTASQQVELTVPVTDRPGPDVYIAQNAAAGYRGYIVEACAGGACWDIGGAAKVTDGGMVKDVTLDGRAVRVLYGPAYIDLGATGPDYDANVSKANAIRITDDGVADVYANGTLGWEPCPQGVRLDAIHAYHVATLCDGRTGRCAIPQGFQPM